MTDLVERARNKNWLWTVPGALREELADEIERLREQRLRAEEKWRKYQTVAQYTNDQQHAEIERLRERNAEMLAELKHVVSHCCDDLTTFTVARIRAAIAKAEGKNH